jgi:hypothetical protein
MSALTPRSLHIALIAALLSGGVTQAAAPVGGKPSGGKPQDAAHAPLAPLDPVAQPAHYQLRYFFLPSLRKIRSVAYLTPLPL